MITIVETPPSLALAFNPINFKIAAKDAQNNPYRAVNARSTLLFLARSINEGDTITVTINGNAVVFTAVAANPTDFQFLASATLSQIATRIGLNYLVAPFLRLSSAADTIVAEAKTAKTTITMSIFSEESDVTITNSPPVAFNAPLGYKLLFSVFFEKRWMNNNWELVAEAEIFADEFGGVMQVPVGSIIKKASESSINLSPFSTYNQSVPQNADIFRRYYVAVREVSDAGFLSQIHDAPRRVLVGGVSTELFLASDFFQTSKWLSYQPNAKRVTRSGLEFITWFNASNTDVDVQLQVKPYNQFGELDIIAPTAFQITVEAQRAAIFPVAPNTLFLPSDTVMYEVQLFHDNGDPLSTIRQYIVVEPKSEWRMLGYLNAFNCPETVWCRGDFTIQDGIVGETWKTSDGSTVGNARQKIETDKKYTYRSGFLSADWKKSLLEIAASPVVYDLTNTAAPFRLVLEKEITNEKTFETLETNYAYEWIFRPFYDSENVEISLPDNTVARPTWTAQVIVSEDGFVPISEDNIVPLFEDDVEEATMAVSEDDILVVDESENIAPFSDPDEL